MKIRAARVELPFEYPFTISRGTKTHQASLLVELEHFGIKGYGEAPAIKYYDITVEKMMADLEAKKSFAGKYAFTEPERYWHFLHHLFPDNPFLVCALDMAAWDLFGKMTGKPLYEVWGLDTSRMPLTDYTIGIDTIDKMVEKMKAKPWPIYKVKVGAPNDLDMIRALRQHTDAVIRVDANAGWSLPEALEKIPVLKELGVELVEQPLPAVQATEMKELFRQSPLPLFADESCAKENEVDDCASAFHGINIKLTKCAGITPARRMIKRARELKLQVMIGCMNETTIGSAAIAHLLPLLDHVDMDGPLLLKEDIATGIDYNNGKISFSGKPGLGVELTKPVFS